MVGDVNMFLSREESADAEGDTTVAEIDIMIAGDVTLDVRNLESFVVFYRQHEVLSMTLIL